MRGFSVGDEIMPTKPAHPCAYPNCPKLTHSRYCEEHTKLANKQYERYGRKYRPSKRYGRAWKRIRDNYAAAHPLCEMCLQQGRYTPTEQIHHKLPLSQGGTNDVENLMALCKACHSRIHSEMGDRWNRKSGRHL